MRARVIQAVVVLGALAAFAGEWETASTGSITVKTRSLEGTGVREVLAEGDLEAPAAAVQEVLLANDRFRLFMPYVKESRFLEGDATTESFVIYMRLDFPVGSSRDYVVKSRTLQRIAPDGSGAFRSQWDALPDRTPPRAHSVRIRLNAGSWKVTPKPGGKSCHVVYQFAVDPGGSLPTFIADFANRRAVPDTYRAIEKEALRLVAEKAAAR